MNDADAYYDVLARIPVPTPKQCVDFARFVSFAHSWYKHLPREQPGATFCFYFDPHVAMEEPHAGTFLPRPDDYRGQRSHLPTILDGARSLALHGPIGAAVASVPLTVRRLHIQDDLMTVENARELRKWAGADTLVSLAIGSAEIVAVLDELFRDGGLPSLRHLRIVRRGPSAPIANALARHRPPLTHVQLAELDAEGAQAFLDGQLPQLAILEDESAGVGEEMVAKLRERYEHHGFHLGHRPFAWSYGKLPP